MTLPHRSAVSKWRDIFISSTFRDLGTHRREVGKTLLPMDLTPHLVEHKANGYEDVLQVCRKYLDDADAYLGIFAYWYGSIPAGHDISVTHIEFEWARKKWEMLSAPPIAVFMPTGKAKTSLLNKARGLLLDDHQGRSAEEVDEALRLHQQRLDAFHETVRRPDGKWKLIRTFRSTSELVHGVRLICYTWQGRLLDTARQPAPELDREPSHAELGMLGRGPHLAAARKVVGQLAAFPEVPGVALLITCDENSGAPELCSWLVEKMRTGRRAGRGRPPVGQYSVETFLEWCGRSLGLAPAGRALDTVDALADGIHGVLESQSLTLLIENVETFPGRASAFHARFWQPLFNALRERRWRQPTAHRLLVIAVDYTRDSRSWDPVSRLQDAPGDPELLVRLPPLQDFTVEDVLLWMDELNVPDDPPGRRLTIAREALRKPGTEEEDGTPRTVFDRLRKQSLWPSE
jgi:hypothetical protein